MRKKRSVIFVFIVFIFLFFLFKISPIQTMDKKLGYLTKDKKYSVELIKNRNTEYANKIHINLIESNERIFTEDISSLSAWKLEVGDVDGDGIDEIALGVYTEAPLHPIYAKRPYIYSFNGEELIPKWRGSRLSKPFIDFVFYDIDKDGWDEIISIEILEDNRYILNSYKWKGFGFEGYLESKALQNKPKLYTDDNSLYIEVIGEEGYSKIGINKENTEIEWGKEDEI